MSRDLERWTVAECLASIATGDDDVAPRLARLFRRLALSKARARSLPRDDGEDAAQEVCLLVMTDRGAALRRVRQPGTPIGAWGAGVLDRLLANRVRARARRPLEANAEDRCRRRGAERERSAAARVARLASAGRGGGATAGTVPGTA